MKKNVSVVSLADQASSLMKEINCSNKDAVALVIREALKAMGGNKEISNKDTDALIALIQAIQPHDTIELHLATQFVVLNLQGMDVLSKSYLNAKGQAMMMLRLSHHALDQLQRYRGKNQAISIVREGGALMNTTIQQEDAF